MKTNICLLAIATAGILPFVSSCSTSPADAAVNAATSNMGPGKSAAVRQATGHGTGPVEKTKDNTLDKVR